MTDPDAARDAADERKAGTLLEQMGGVAGLIYSTLPILVFVPANTWFGLRGAIIAALATAAAILAYRLYRREDVTPAISGFFGVAICAFIANRTGDAKGYFLFGIWTMLVYSALLIVSIIVRWPLIGVLWNAVNGAGTAWRRHRPTLIAYDLATAVWAVVFIARYLVQHHLYDTGRTGLLAGARIGMGWPLTILAVVATVLLVRRAERVEDEIESADS
ncbi:MAG: DUF3159 domain-containing protein [Gordonia sp. (in: high G+C Gram-positive bacteria)]|uniref:DUF3159 domain-containing protein n=1 Tax=Gordonia sp. (in: high G+C Gram-positive bacteria) TaxID=84139 RepID=UPI0039E3D8DB